MHRRFTPVRAPGRIARAAALLAAVTAGGMSAAAVPAAAQEAPVVVELYTSQGCNSCPPADAYFAELVRQPGIIALSFHVDYWNYLGWHDTFSSKKATYRQKTYAMGLRQSGVYTPQMVIGGKTGVVGSDRRAVEAAMREARRAPMPVAVLLEKLGGNRLKVTIAAATGAAEGAEIWAFLFDKRQSTKILHGENEGKTFVYHHVVRDFRRIGLYTGAKTEFPLPVLGEKGEKRSGAAVIVQPAKGGTIIGAAIATVEE